MKKNITPLQKSKPLPLKRPKNPFKQNEPKLQ